MLAFATRRLNWQDLQKPPKLDFDPLPLLEHSDDLLMNSYNSWGGIAKEKETVNKIVDLAPTVMGWIDKMEAQDR